MISLISYGKASAFVLLLPYIPKHHITFTVSPPPPPINANSGNTESEAISRMLLLVNQYFEDHCRHCNCPLLVWVVYRDKNQ